MQPLPNVTFNKGQLKRRQAITDAAVRIISKYGEDGLNMRALASEAGVSLATPYNLFGSKQAVLRAVYDDDFEKYTCYFDEHSSPDPLWRIFDLVELSIEYCQSRPEFYHALFSSLYRNSGAEFAAGAWSLRKGYVAQLVATAIEAGDIEAGALAPAVANSLYRIHKAVSQEWIDGVVTLEEAQIELGMAFGLILASVVTPQARRRFATICARYSPAFKPRLVGPSA